MRKAIVENGVVINIIIAEDSFEIEGVELVNVDGLVVDIGYAASLVDGIYQFTLPPSPTPEPTELEILQLKVAQQEQDNKLLRAQVQANSDVSDFHEELIVEMAMMVYQ